MEPGKAQLMIRLINDAVENSMVMDGQPVLLTSPVVRPHLAQLLQRFIPTLPVISQAEIPADIRLHSLKNVVFDHAG